MFFLFSFRLAMLNAVKDFFNNFIGQKHSQSLQRVLRYPKGTERERDTESHARRSPTLKANVIKTNEINTHEE